MSGFFEDYHYFRPEEKRGIMVLLAIIFVTVAAVTAVHFKQDEPLAAADTKGQKKEYQEFAASTKQADSLRESRTYGRQRRQEEKIERILKPFDPNTADSIELRQLGLSAFATRNLIRYREHGGRFRTPDDMSKIYGMDSTLFAELKDYIRIEGTERQTGKATASLLLPNKRDTASLLLPTTQKPYPRQEKYPEGTTVSINEADTTELKKIPGIGSVIAGMIVRYRERLGGYYDISQLYDINIDAKRLTSWLYADSSKITRIPVNSSISRLLRHPYINFEQAKAISNYRKKYGKLTSLKPLILYEEFTEEDFERISRYLLFDE